ncbi:ergothioneine biosynthesis protein EgtB [Actinoplanes utahensis]|uniref:Hercynine oxygenase n=1 Tax=Actinoplanes utahensis TaxID=1869 RepID=A0A0A6UHY3_ACTUT|nr:ergothioneine biosynthesis protein EgtB [Actinoplanes utahensis]KHD75061.1 sulfatase-modifying factor 1 [Actinoplanes utahensis]GIF28466.1 hercynine oxygenase [Actinoplanes utahensis]
MTTEDLRLTIAAELERTRARTALLTEAVDDDDLTRQHSPLMSPLVWDLAHVGNQEELWLVRDVGGRDPVRQDIDELYDAFKHARRDRPALPLLDPLEARAYVARVRDKALDVLDRVRFDPGARLLDGGFAFGMIVQHEQQHDETMLATHQLRTGSPVLTAPPPPAAANAVRGEIFIDAGGFVMGTDTEPWALDNERPAHTVDLGAFWIDAAPTTNGQYAAFIDAGGYDDPRWWSERGWAHRQKAGLAAPLHWIRDRDGWLRRRFGHVEPVPMEEPVVHVCYFEAEAYAAWAGKRLPTEAEWEKAARFDPATGRSRRYPWGDDPPGPAHANLGQRHLSPAPVGAYPAGASPLGVHQLIGDVWEWVSSGFEPYPGFRAFPYPEYSEVFHGGDYKVLRGGSFGTDAAACRGTFRNWDHPIRRQIFSGFRCARDHV